MTTEAHRTRHRGDRDSAEYHDNDYGNEAERAAAGALARQHAELGVELRLAEAHEILSRVEQQGIADLYFQALNTSVAVKQSRAKRREMRRLRGQPARGESPYA